MTLSLPGARLQLAIEGFSAPLSLLGFTLSEGISELFRGELSVSCDPAFTLEPLVGASACLRWVGQAGALRTLRGMISQVDTPPSSAPTRCTLHLSPPHLRLALSRRLRVFQDRTTRQIVEEVLAGGAVGPCRWRLRTELAPRDYCVQYRESDWDFVCRLLEEEGISYHLEQVGDELTTFFTDDLASFARLDGVTRLRVLPRPPTGQEAVHKLAWSEELRPTRVTLRDHSFRAPRAR